MDTTSTLKIEPASNVYELNGVDIGDKLSKISIEVARDMLDSCVTIETGADISFTGYVLNHFAAKPLICKCGHKLSDLSADCDVMCPECGKRITVVFGVVEFE